MRVVDVDEFDNDDDDSTFWFMGAGTDSVEFENEDDCIVEFDSPPPEYTRLLPLIVLGSNIDRSKTMEYIPIQKSKMGTIKG